MDSASDDARRGPRDWRMPVAAALVVIATVAAYGRVCSHEFAGWDDYMTIYRNPLFDPPTRASMAEPWRAPQKGLYVPVTYSYWGALAMVAQTPDAGAYGVRLSPTVYHTGSLVLHAAAGLLVLAILNLLSGNVWASLAGALVFALHPVQVETVAWASGVKDLLAGLLSLCAIYQYLLFARATERRARCRHYGLGGAVLILAMLAKPSAMAVPAIAAAIDLLLLRRPWKTVAWAAGGWAALVLPLVVVARIVQTLDNVTPLATWTRPLVAADALAFYAWKLVWPATLSIDYARHPDRVMGMWGGAWPFAAGALVAAAAFCAWRAGARRPWIRAAALVFVAGVGPVLGLTPFMFQYTSTVADHYLYLAMLGPALVATWALAHSRGRAATTLAVVAVAAMGVRSNHQLAHWKTDRAAWTHAMTADPQSFVAPANLGVNYAREGAALADLSEAARGAGQVAEADRLADRRRACYERAAELAERALAINPEYAAAHRNAANYNFILARDLKAAEHLDALLALNARRPAAARKDLSGPRDLAASTWAKLGRYDKAAAHYEILIATSKAHRTLAVERLAEMRAKMAEAKLDAADPRP